MQAKPFYLSKAVIGFVVGLLGFVLNLFHVSIADLTPELSDALGGYVNNTLILAGLIAQIVGRIKARTVLVPSPAKADAHNDALILTQAQTAAPAGASASTPSPAAVQPPRPIDLTDK